MFLAIKIQTEESRAAPWLLPENLKKLQYQMEFAMHIRKRPVGDIPKAQFVVLGAFFFWASKRNE